MKKLFSVLMTVLLIGALLLTAIPGFSAASALDTNAKASFSFACDKAGYEFSIYNVGNISKTSTDPYKVAYNSTIDSLSESILNGDSVALLSALDDLSSTDLGSPVATYSTDNDGNTKAFTDMELGIYYVRATNFPAGVKEVTNSVFALPYYDSAEGWLYSVENIALATKVVDTVPEIVKTITNSTRNSVEYTDVSLGDTVEYEIKSTTVGSVNSVESRDFRLNSYIVSDTMSKGLTLNQDSFVVTLEDVDGNTLSTLDPATDYVVDITAEDGKDTTFTVSLTDTYLQETEFYSAYNLVIAYSAVLNDDAVRGTAGNPNTAVDVTYSNKNDVTDTVEGNTVYAYTYGIEVNKYDDAGNTLAGADFELYLTEADAQAETNAIATGTSDANGLVEFYTADGEVIRLESGTYFVKETKAPTGYNRYTDVIPVVVDVEYSETFTDGTWVKNSPENGIAVVSVKDSKVVLPQTGGMGNYLIYLIAGLGLALSVVLFVTKKRTAKSSK